MSLTSEQLYSTIDALGLKYQSLLITGDVELLDESEKVTVACPLETVMDLSSAEKADLGVAVNPEPRHRHAIARLRDMHCRRVLLLLGPSTWSTNDLLAMGFIPLGEATGQLAFLHDLDLINQPREWNNASNWANPENFDRDR